MCAPKWQCKACAAYMWSRSQPVRPGSAKHAPDKLIHSCKLECPVGSRPSCLGPRLTGDITFCILPSPGHEYEIPDDEQLPTWRLGAALEAFLGAPRLCHV